MMTAPQWKQVFDEEGYVHFSQLLNDYEVKSLRTAIEVAATEVTTDNPLSSGGMRFASNLYRVSESLQRFLGSESLVNILCGVGGPDLWVRWDQAVWKRAGAPEFPWHQDNGYTGLDVEHLQLWIALTRADGANGGLVVCPRGHREVLEHRAVGDYMTAEPPGTELLVEAEPGDVILFSSYLPHCTRAHSSGDTRLAYVAEFLPTTASDTSVESPHLVIAQDGRGTHQWSYLSGDDEPPLGRAADGP